MRGSADSVKQVRDRVSNLVDEPVTNVGNLLDDLTANCNVVVKELLLGPLVSILTAKMVVFHNNSGSGIGRFL